jgi:AraC-like DNA-binding protein
MKYTIPTYKIEELDGKEPIKEVFFTDKKLHLLKDHLNKPYRSNYYGLGLCISGKANLMANLDKYEIVKDTIITMSPQVIKQWVDVSDDFDTFTIFFTKAFLVKHFLNQHHLEQFDFFEQNTKHVNQFTENETRVILELLLKIQFYTHQTHTYQNEIVANYINILLFEYQSIFGNKNLKESFQHSRGQQITDEFKKLVNIHFKVAHSVKFYADKLFITAKHLSEIVKQETGKTASEWIDELLLLEAKILLSNPILQISQIAEVLHFPDASTFGKFFKNLVGVSPLHYRKDL